MFDIAFQLIAEIKSMEDDATAYIVGGAVRDYLLGKECDDIDIATSVSIDKLEKIYETVDIGANKDFGILVIKYHGFVFEVANYREDGDYSDGRRPDEVKIVKDFFTDSKRRDFTINAMAMDSDKNIIDYHGGQDDLKNKIIRTVGRAEDRFSEDYLRILRAIRFASVLDFQYDEDVEGAIMAQANNLTKISTERIWKEFWKMAHCNGFSSGIFDMWNLGVLTYILPEIDCMNNYPHYKKHHPEGNVWRHVFSVLQHLDNQSAVVKLGGLFHDIGKPVAYKIEDSGKFHYYMHDYIGLDVFDKVVERIHIPKDIANEVKYSIKNHMKMHNFLVMKDSKCYDMIDSPYWDSLYQVAYADDKSRLYLFDREFWNKVDAKVARIKLIVERKKVMSGILNGKLVMNILGISGGPKVGEVLKKAVAYVVNNNMDLTLDEDYQKIVKYIKTLK